MNAQIYLNNFWDRNLPVDPWAIARHAGVHVEPLPADAPDGFSGDYTPADSSGAPLIRYNASHSPLRQRFTVAHELGHHAHGHGLSFRDDKKSNFASTSYDPAEVAANHFAAELLMPSIVVEHLIPQVNSIKDMAMRFQVSEVAMIYRLKNLGYLTHG